MSWQTEYLSALQSRDESQKSNYELVDAYSKLADHIAVLEANAINKEKSHSSTAHSVATADHEGDPQIRVELAEALRAKGQLQTRLKSAEDSRDELRARLNTDDRLIKQLQAEKAILTIKVRDRDEELQGKTQLLVEVQDENMSLNLQLNVADQQTTKLRKENKELVDRWMARMGKEADAMNDTLRT